MSKGATLIAEERIRQILSEGYNSTHDECEHDAGELAACGAAYALNASCVLYPHNGLPLDQPPIFWMFPPDAWKPKTPLRDLVRAGALIAAEIDRLLANPHDGVARKKKETDYDGWVVRSGIWGYVNEEWLQTTRLASAKVWPNEQDARAAALKAEERDDEPYFIEPIRDGRIVPEADRAGAA